MKKDNLFQNFKNHKYLFLITIAYFILGMINIHFALLAIVCMSIPMILLFKNNKKVWCQGYCPRANLYSKSGKILKSSRKTPVFFVKGNMKWIILTYFIISIVLITISTIQVVNGALPMYYLRLFIIIPLDFINFPQLFFIDTSPWLIHLSYRFYSMMLSTTILGLVLGIIYKPRTWCTICPISTISDAYIKSKK